MSMVKDSEFLEPCLQFPVLHIRAFTVPHCTGQGTFYSHTSTGSVRVKLSQHWKPVWTPESPGNLQGLGHELMFLDLWWGCDLRAVLLIFIFQ